MFGTEKF